jgi:hypothetical protein
VRGEHLAAATTGVIGAAVFALLLAGTRDEAPVEQRPRVARSILLETRAAGPIVSEPLGAEADVDQVIAYLRNNGDTLPEHEVRRLFQKIRSAVGLEAMGSSGFFPTFFCETRCPRDGENGDWTREGRVCMQSCGLDFLERHPEPFALNFALWRAKENGDADAYRAIVDAHPDVWEARRDLFASHGPTEALAAWSSATLRVHAPALQTSLFQTAQHVPGAPGRLLEAASGWATCESVGGQAICR